MTESRENVTKWQEQESSIRSDRLQVFNYNNPLFYCFASSHCYTPSRRCGVPEHWHEDIEYLYVIDGELEYSVNGERILLEKGEGICVNTRRIHYNVSEKGRFCDFYCITIHPSYLCASTYIEQKFVTPLLSPNSFDYLILRKGDWTEQIIDEIKSIFENSDTLALELRILEVQMKIHRIIYTNIDLSAVVNNPSPIHINTYKTMVMYIQDHYMDKVSLEEIANAGNVGKTLCAKIFKKYASKTPGDYLIHYRITRSIDLLTGSDMSITEIAYATGFTSASHYTKTFRETMGTTPNQYRNTNLGDTELTMHRTFSAR